MRRRRWALATGLLFLAVIGWWLQYVPYTPLRLYRAIPADAAMVSVHRDLADRWDSLSGNPLARSILSSAGVDPAELDSLTGDRRFQAALHHLAGREVVLAYVPVLGDTGRPGWVAASWLGGRSHQLRWLSAFLDLEGVEAHRLQTGHTYWTVQTDALDDDLQPSFALVEGMLVACLSASPHALREVLACYDGSLPSMAVTWRGTRRLHWPMRHVAPDRGWVDLEAIRRRSGRVPSPLYYELTDVADDRIRGAVSASWAAPGAPEPMAEPAMEDLARFLAHLPLAVGLGPQALASELLAKAEEGGSLQTVAAVIDQVEPTHLVVCLLGGDYSGRFRGVRVPTVLVGGAVTQPEQAAERMRLVLDELNARHRWGLIPRAYRAGSRVVHAVETVENNPYGALESGEQVAYAVTDRWIFACSNFAALHRIMVRYAAIEALPPSHSRAWAAVGETPEALLSGWIDLVRGGEAARKGMAAYALKLIVDDPEASQETRETLNVAKAWIEAFAPLQTCRLRLRREGRDMATLHIELGP